MNNMNNVGGGIIQVLNAPITLLQAPSLPICASLTQFLVFRKEYSAYKRRGGKEFIDDMIPDSVLKFVRTDYNKVARFEDPSFEELPGVALMNLLGDYYRPQRKPEAISEINNFKKCNWESTNFNINDFLGWLADFEEILSYCEQSFTGENNKKFMVQLIVGKVRPEELSNTILANLNNVMCSVDSLITIIRRDAQDYATARTSLLKFTESNHISKKRNNTTLFESRDSKIPRPGASNAFVVTTIPGVSNTTHTKDSSRFGGGVSINNKQKKNTDRKIQFKEGRRAKKYGKQSRGSNPCAQIVGVANQQFVTAGAQPVQIAATNAQSSNINTNNNNVQQIKPSTFNYPAGVCWGCGIGWKGDAFHMMKSCPFKGRPGWCSGVPLQLTPEERLRIYEQ